MNPREERRVLGLSTRLVCSVLQTHAVFSDPSYCLEVGLAFLDVAIHLFFWNHISTSDPAKVGSIG